MADSMDQDNFGFNLDDPSIPLDDDAKREILTGHELWEKLTLASHRDRASQGRQAAATCPFCDDRSAIPSFGEDDDGNTVTEYECISCGCPFT